MGKFGAKTSRQKTGNSSKTVTPEVSSDQQAKNLLSFKKVQNAGVSKGNKTRNRQFDKKPQQVKKVPKKRVYTEKELNIPKLNTSLDPVGVAVKGKKGKKFVTDDILSQLVSEVNEETNSTNASKLEKARQLEEIREHKRKEMEQREQDKKDKLDRKKSDIKKRKSKGSEPKLEEEPVDSKKKRKVRFS